MTNNNEPFSWIEGYFDRLSYSIRGGVADYFRIVGLSPEWAVAQTSRSRPNMICDLIGQRALEAFVDLPVAFQS